MSTHHKSLKTYVVCVHTTLGNDAPDESECEPQLGTVCGKIAHDVECALCVTRIQGCLCCILFAEVKYIETGTIYIWHMVVCS